VRAAALDAAGLPAVPRRSPGAGQLAACFRVADDSTFADREDATFDLANDASVGIVHRLDLDDATAGEWGQIFADYEVLQLSREVARLTDAAGRAGRSCR